MCVGAYICRAILMLYKAVNVEIKIMHDLRTSFLGKRCMKGS